MARVPALVALLGPALVLALFAAAWSGGGPEAPRQAWLPWLAAAFAFVGALGPALLAQGRIERATARGLVMLALAGLGTHALLVALVPLQPGESGFSLALAAGDLVLSGVLVALAALGVRRGWAVLTLLLAALFMARAIGVASSSFATGVRLGETLLGAFLWGGAALLAAALAARRFTRSGR